ncbi:heme o synthase [Spirochaetota bacterium]
MISNILNILKFYIQLIKVPQTGLLLFTGFAGYMSSVKNIDSLLLTNSLVGLLLVISGTTALNMVFDKDIDHIMARTKKRPIPKKKVSPKAATIFGIILIVGGSILNYRISIPFLIVVLAGTFFDLVIYTIWLKRRSPWSIVFGGLAGGMPILAGRVLAIGNVDLIGLLLACSIVMWIPTHILTLAMNYSDDYHLAGVPTFPNVFGFIKARYFIAVSNILSAVIFISIFILLNIEPVGFYISLAGSLLLLILSFKMIIQTDEKSNKLLFKYASIYMFVLMLILVLK